MKTFNISIADKQAERLKALKDRTGISRSEHIRRAIDVYLERVVKTEKLFEESHAEKSEEPTSTN